MKAKHFKYVDDMTLAESINLKDVLETQEGNDLTRPFNYHSRLELSLSQSQNKLQETINKLKAYTEGNEMRINKKMTKVMLFNQAIKYDFMPEIKLGDGEFVEAVEQFILLGVIVTSGLKWHMNTKHITPPPKASTDCGCSGHSPLILLPRRTGHSKYGHAAVRLESNGNLAAEM